jgi:DNA-binding TFAR19-related protein (PDSD5 family)
VHSFIHFLGSFGACAVARVALVKPDKARNVENMILTAAKRGALQSKVSHKLPGTLK